MQIVGNPEAIDHHASTPPDFHDVGRVRPPLSEYGGKIQIAIRVIFRRLLEELMTRAMQAASERDPPCVPGIRRKKR
jgi:hypothetical protein